MVEVDDKVLATLEEELTRDYRTNKFTTLEKLNLPISKFNNLKFGKNDEVNYYLITTSDITEEGTIILGNPEGSLKQTGGKKGVAKYKINKGDILFPQIGRLRSVGVMVDESSVPYVGNHGLMRIACGADNLDMAFLIKDYLQLSSVGKFIAKSKITIDILKKLPIPIVGNKICGYMEPSIKIKQCKKETRKLQMELGMMEEKLQLNAFQGNHDANRKINDAIKNALKNVMDTLKKVQTI